MNRLIYCVLFIQILGGTEIDLIIPSFPDLQLEYNLSMFSVELLLTLNIFIFCIFSLIVGELGQKFNSRNTIIIGLIIFTLGSIACVISTSYSHLLFGHIVQAIGIAGPCVLSHVIISDHYGVLKHQQLMGMINSVATLSMACAPIIGSYLNLWFKWRSNFLALLILGIVCLIQSYLTIPIPRKSSIKKINQITYKELFKTKELLYYVFINSFSTMPYWLFISLAPILYMETLKVDIKYFGFYQGSLALNLAIISFFSSMILKKIGPKKCINLSIVFLLIFIILTILVIIFNINQPLIITLVMQCLTIGITMPVNILYPLSLNVVVNAKEKIAALMMFAKWSLITISIQLISYFYNHNFNIIGITMVLSLFIAGFFYFKLLKNNNIFLDLNN